MATPPASWELATPVYGIRYPRTNAPAKYLPDAFQHIGSDLESALIAGQGTPGGNTFTSGTDAQRLASTPTKDLIWVVTDVPGNPQYLGTGTAWIPLGGTGGLSTTWRFLAQFTTLATGTKSDASWSAIPGMSWTLNVPTQAVVRVGFNISTQSTQVTDIVGLRITDGGFPIFEVYHAPNSGISTASTSVTHTHLFHWTMNAGAHPLQAWWVRAAGAGVVSVVPVDIRPNTIWADLATP